LTGIKQSGVTLAGFLGGVTLPALESRFGWRGACWAYAGAFLVAAAAIQFLLHRDPPRPTAHERATAAVNDQPLDRIIYWITIYAFFMGLAAGATGRFLPLYAEESLGFGTGVVGLIIALGGLLGMAARIAAARLAEHRISPTRLLPILSLVGAAFALMLALLTPSTRNLLWIGPLLNAIGTNAWNAVAMLAVIMFVSTAKAGKASGIVMVGFLGGLAVSGPTTGAIVDSTGSYTSVWVGATVVSLLAALIMTITDRRGRRRHAATVS
jgi:predicted MFS family arabinose efflux permease